MFRKLHSQRAAIFVVIQVYMGASLLLFLLKLLFSDELSMEGLMHAYRSELHPALPGLGLLLVVWATFFCHWYVFRKKKYEEIIGGKIFVSIRDLGLDFENLGVKLSDKPQRTDLVVSKLSFLVTSMFRLLQVYVGFTFLAWALYLFMSDLSFLSWPNVRYAMSEGIGPFYPGFKKLLALWLGLAILQYMDRKKSRSEMSRGASSSDLSGKAPQLQS